MLQAHSDLYASMSALHARYILVVVWSLVFLVARPATDQAASGAFSPDYGKSSRLAATSFKRSASHFSDDVKIVAIRVYLNATNVRLSPNDPELTLATSTAISELTDALAPGVVPQTEQMYYEFFGSAGMLMHVAEEIVLLTGYYKAPPGNAGVLTPVSE